MAGGEDVTPARGKDGNLVSHLGAHLLHRAEWNGVLLVEPRVEDQPVAEGRLQSLGLHLRRLWLGGVYHVDTGIDNVGQEIEDRAVAVKEHLGSTIGLFLDEPRQLGVIGLHHLTVERRRDEGRRCVPRSS